MAKCIEGKYTNNVFDIAAGAGTGGKFALVGAVGADPSGITSFIVLSGDGAVQEAPAEGWRLSSLRLINVNAGIKKVSIFAVTDPTGTPKYDLLGVAAVPAKAGYDGSVAAFDALNTTLFPDMTVDNAGNKWSDIPAGKTLAITCETADCIKVAGKMYDYVA